MELVYTTLATLLTLLLIGFLFALAILVPVYLVYFIIGLVKQDFNAAMLFLLLGHIVTRLVLTLAFATSGDSLSLIPQLMLMNVAGFLAICSTFAGWILSSFFRPMNE